jgi:putative GTP pyrophosphokinase
MNEQKENEPVFDFEKHKRVAIDKYRQVRPLYEDFSNVIKSLISQLLSAHHIKVYSIEARAKDIESFGKKSSAPSLDNPNIPKYPNPINDITDLAGIRVITFYPRSQDKVDAIIKDEFDLIELSDKAELLIKDDKFGYASIHYLIKLKANRTDLPEYNRFKNLMAEIQVRTILQHAWAEIEHDIQYKSTETIPSSIHRIFMSLSGLIEITDREFQTIQDEDERLRKQARESIKEDKLEKVEITADALKTYLNKKLGSDRRMTDYSYNFTARLLRQLGFTDFKQIEECIRGYDDDKLSRILYGTRQGQLSRFEYQLLAAMGENFINLHPWEKLSWFKHSKRWQLEKLAGAGVSLGSYSPKG